MPWSVCLLTLCAALVPVASPAVVAQQDGAPVPVFFVDEGVDAGVDAVSYGRGASMVDLDGDGLLDLVAINSIMDNFYYRQLPDHTFEDASGDWAVPQDTRYHWAAVVADLDNDGDHDIFIGNGGRTSTEANQLLRNDIDQDTHAGVFTDVSVSAGIAGKLDPTFGVTSLDYNKDGLLDIFVANAKDIDGSTCTLWRNDGDLTFTDVSVSAGITHDGNYRHPGVGDFDNDGWPDIAVGAYFTDNLLYRNLGDGTFEELGVAAGIAETGDSDFGIVFADYDNDGWQDLYTPKLNSVLGIESRVWRNNGDDTFSVALEFGIHQDMGHNSMDVDSDGHPDVYIGTGNPPMPSPDLLFKITPGPPGTLLAEDISLSSGILANGDTRCHGVTFGDYDDDGDVDIYTNNGGPMGDSLEPNFLWTNQGTGNNWVALDLTGTVSNRSAVGTRSVARTWAGREIHLMRAAGQGFGNSDSPTQHYGLGQDQAVQRIDVLWPSGIEQVLLSPAINQRHSMIETGLILDDAPVAQGETATLECHGRPDHVFDIFISTSLGVELPLPDYGGVFQLSIPYWYLTSVTVDAEGHGALPLPIPVIAELSGLDVYFQSWSHPVGSEDDDVISNVEVLSIL